jgi:hypothetical protein
LTVSRRQNSIQVITINGAANGGFRHIVKGPSESLLIVGDFTINYQTDGGDPSRDVDVVITVKPNHSKESAEISYTATPVPPKA